MKQEASAGPSPAASPRDAPAQPTAAPAQAQSPAEDQEPLPLVQSRFKRVLLTGLAVVSLGIAMVGLVVPGLPSTEFVLLAAWAAARSSPRLHAWLYRSAWFGPALRHWRNGRRVTRRAKYWASASMTACAALMLHTVPHWWVNAPAIACMAGVLVWIWRRPEP